MGHHRPIEDHSFDPRHRGMSGPHHHRGKYSRVSPFSLSPPVVTINRNPICGVDHAVSNLYLGRASRPFRIGGIYMGHMGLYVKYIVAQNRTLARNVKRKALNRPRRTDA